MKKNVFLFSGEGTRSSESSPKLLRTSRYWAEIESILQSQFNLSLEELWTSEQYSHRCPSSPLVTVAAEICLSDIWKGWGYEPDIVVGHSIGELTAAYLAGFYSLEEILLLTHAIGSVTEKLDGAMLHGTLSDDQIFELDIALSSVNFMVGDKKHVTVSCFRDEIDNFLANHRNFIEMKPAHPWHHRDYRDFVELLPEATSKEGTDAFFVSGVTTRFENTLETDHWRKWLSHPIDFISSMTAITEKFPDSDFDIIEIGFHPVLEKCCQVLPAYQYVSSMYRGEDEVEWILFQRKKLAQSTFITRLEEVIEPFRAGLDFKTSLSYQGFTSLTFVQFTALLQPFFPNLAPQDFYRYKSISQLIELFGTASPESSQLESNYRRNEVVIAGMSCKFPASVGNPYQFWEMLKKKEDQVRAESDRGDFEAGFLSNELASFDHRFFNISEAEARTMDPQQILALELTELLWRDAGLDPDTLDRKRIGVYIGAWNEEYLGNKDSVYYPTGTNPSIIASRISYHYDLRGPSWVANTACSSSLLALHYACKDIEAGRIDYAIAGGVNMILGNSSTHSMRDSGFLSVDQRCKTFDDSANGYVRAEGGGLVLLANKDLATSYYAELAGSAINQNGGRAQVITAPHPEAQEELILDACQDAGISPTEISYVECHGTGTKIGDPIEISALQNTIAKDRETGCFLGSVKSNMGHLESAAGIAGLLKSLLILNHSVIPANLHFAKPNQFIDFATYGLSVVDQETPIDPRSFIGISSFGFGGANAHVIIKGVKQTLRKAVVDLPSPFDAERATSLSSYYRLDETAERELEKSQKNQYGPEEINKIITDVFFNLTGIKEIDPDVDLTDQGLDSLSATQFISSLQDELGIEIDTDLLFDYPFIDQMVAVLTEQLSASTASESGNRDLSRDDVAEIMRGIFYELTTIKDVDPDIELTDQGLDSLSGTQFIMQLESQLKTEIDTDVLFEYPLFDQLVDEIHGLAQK
jgi:acyl transferase domain-containing protein/acyl carrier protein